jgi:hypothetical protein
MSVSKNEAVLRRITEEERNQGDLAVLEELYAPDAASRDRTIFKDVVQASRRAVPDLYGIGRSGCSTRRIGS